MCSEGEVGMSGWSPCSGRPLFSCAFQSLQWSKPPLWGQLSTCSLWTWRWSLLRCRVGVAVGIWECSAGPSKPSGPCTPVAFSLWVSGLCQDYVFSHKYQTFISELLLGPEAEEKASLPAKSEKSCWPAMMPFLRTTVYKLRFRFSSFWVAKQMTQTKPKKN